VVRRERKRDRSLGLDLAASIGVCSYVAKCLLESQLPLHLKAVIQELARIHQAEIGEVITGDSEVPGS
jgi:hypothetical protein